MEQKNSVNIEVENTQTKKYLSPKKGPSPEKKRLASPAQRVERALNHQLSFQYRCGQANAF